MKDMCSVLDSGTIIRAFGDLAPPLTQFPHVIVEAGPAFLKLAIDSVCQTGGVFGDEPPVDGSGEPYLIPEDGEIIDDFVLWELPDNQKALFRYGCYAKLDVFTMVISTRSSAALLSRLYSLFGSGINDYESIFFYYNCIERVAEAIPELGWAYIPLSDELPYAMFVAGPGHEFAVESIESILNETRVRYFHVGRRTDPGPNQKPR